MIVMLALLLAVLNNTNPRVSYACDGVTAAFTVNFPYQLSSDLAITSTTAAGAVTTLTQGTDWSVNLSGTSSTATLTLTNPGTKCPTGSILKIARTNIALIQSTGFRQQTTYNPTLHETVADRTVMQIQELNDSIAALQLSGTATFGTPSVVDGTTVNSTSGTSTSLVRSDAKPATTYTGPGALTAARAFYGKFSDFSSILDFAGGCDNTGTTSNNTCFANARAQMALTPGVLIFPSGTYNYSVTPNWAIQGLRIVGLGKVVLNFTGAGNAWVVDGGTPTGLVFDVQMENLTISGNATATNGLFLRSVHHSRFRDIRVNNVSAACLLTNFAVVDTFDTFRCSNNEAAFTTTPVNGMVFDQRGAGEQTTSGTVIDPIIEGMSGTGIKFVNAVRMVVNAGTSEGNAGRGLEVNTNSGGNTFIGMDLEVNAIEDVLVQGADNQFINIGSGSAGAVGLLHFTSAAAKRNMVQGGIYNNITIDASVPNTRLIGAGYNANGAGALTDNGSFTIKINTVNITTGVADGPVLDSPTLLASSSAGQNIVNGTTPVVVFGTVERDSDAAYNSGTGRFTVPTGKGGDYQITCEVSYVVALPSGGALLSIFKNAVEMKQWTMNAPQINQSLLISDVLSLVGGDIIDCRTAHAEAAGKALIPLSKLNYIAIKRMP